MRPSGLIADQLGDTPRSPPPRPAPSQPAGGAYLGASILRDLPARRLHHGGLRALGCPGIGLQYLGHGRRRRSGERARLAAPRRGPRRAARDRPARVSPSPRPADVWSPPRSAGAPSPRNTAGPRPGGDAATSIPTRGSSGRPLLLRVPWAWPGFPWESSPPSPLYFS